MKPKTRKLVFFVLCLMVIPVFFSFAQMASSKQADPLFRLLATQKPDTNKLRNLLILACHQIGRLDYSADKKSGLDNVLHLIQQAGVLSARLHSGQYHQKAQRFHAKYYFLSGAFEESMRKLLKVIQCYKRTGNTYQEASAWNIILTALLLFAILGFVGCRFYRYKQKDNDSILKSHKLVELKNKQLELLVEEKEWLLKEVHHRVKNNLHTIICLLESQAAFMENDALEAMENSQNRIYTMSLIHQKLYQSDDIQTIDMSIYIPELLQYLKDIFDTSSDQICFHINIAQISLSQTIAIPIALILNEAVTNSIKYAFPGNTGGEIWVSLQEENSSIKLELADNGVGITNNIQDIEPLSLGLQLIKGLSKEIQGDLIIKSEGGVKITMIFKKYPY